MKTLFIVSSFLFLVLGGVVNAASKNMEWKIKTMKDDFKGTSYTFIHSSLVRPSVPLRFPYEDLVVRMNVFCDNTIDEVDLSFNQDLSLIEGRRTNFNSSLYSIEARLDNKFETLYGEIKNESRNTISIQSGKRAILNYKEVAFQIKHSSGTTHYKFDLTNFPKSCN